MSEAHDHRFDCVLRGGLVFDGRGAAPRRADVAIRDGVVRAVDANIDGSLAARVEDVSGKWVMPGFVDVHTHYDAEVEVAPALGESLRHGITTAIFGSCSLGTALSSAEDIADMFTRVEGIPYEHVLPLFQRVKSWSDPKGYRAHFDAVPLGPNVSAFVGHSDLRAHVMGLGASVTEGQRPTNQELATMKRLLEEGMDAGLIGLSLNTNRWDKLGGTRFRSKPLPATYARWDEIRALSSIVRDRHGILQGIPNISAKYDTLLFLAESAALNGRPPLKLSMVSLADVRSNRLVYKAISAITRFTNSVLGGDVRWQGLPMVFDLFVDGLDAPIFEEFSAGTAALHLTEAAERRRLLGTDKYRGWFRRQWTSMVVPRVYHRDFGTTRIVSCPDPSLVGRTFRDVARARKQDEVQCFLDLCIEHGDKLRWYTTIANDRVAHLRSIMANPDVQPGFSDAGAHLRNMAFYNFGLCLLKLARDAEREGVAFMPVERAVHRLSGEIAEWLGLDAGTLAVDSRADLVVVDPEHLDETLLQTHEEAIPEFGGYTRMVRRNNAAVPMVMVNGRVAVRDGEVRSEVGRERGFGRFLGANERVRPGASARPSSEAASSATR
ncbi:MAG: amidohydrolase family protein [Polyangiales bacterium]